MLPNCCLIVAWLLATPRRLLSTVPRRSFRREAWASRIRVLNHRTRKFCATTCNKHCLRARESLEDRPMGSAPPTVAQDVITEVGKQFAPVCIGAKLSLLQFAKVQTSVCPNLQWCELQIALVCSGAKFSLRSLQCCKHQFVAVCTNLQWCKLQFAPVCSGAVART